MIKLPYVVRDAEKSTTSRNIFLSILLQNGVFLKTTSGYYCFIVVLSNDYKTNLHIIFVWTLDCRRENSMKMSNFSSTESPISVLLTLTSYTCIFVVIIIAARRPVGALKNAGFIPIAGEGVNVYRSSSLAVHWSIVAIRHTAIPQTLADNLCNRILDKVIVGDGPPKFHSGRLLPDPLRDRNHPQAL